MQPDRRIIVPAVALVLCAAAMIGIGYGALTSTYETDGGSIDGGAFEVSVSDGSGNAMKAFDVEMCFERHATEKSDGSMTYYYTAQGRNMDDGVLSSDVVLLRNQHVSVTDETGLGYGSYTITVDVLYKGNTLSYAGISPTVDFSGTSGTANGNSITVAAAEKNDAVFTVHLDLTGKEIRAEDVWNSQLTMPFSTFVPAVQVVVTVVGNQ